jgi:histidyl-tRNA synthetase
MSNFLSVLYDKYCIRISHIDVIQAPLKELKISDYDKRRIIGFLENYQAEELFNLLTKINFDKNIGNILLDLAHLNVCSIDEGLLILNKYPKFYKQTINEISILASSLNSDVLKNCLFDGGIYRSLDFYSGLIFQCDLGDTKECAGGGEFTGLVESFGVNQTVYSIGMAAGVERLMKVF